MSKSRAAQLVLAIDTAGHVAEETERDMAHIARDLFGPNTRVGQSYQETIREVASMSDTHLITLMGIQGVRPIRRS
jgi:hypothetical protein